MTIEERALGRRKAEVALVLAHLDGRIVAGNSVWQHWLAGAEACTHLTQVAAHWAVPALLDAQQRLRAGQADPVHIPWQVEGRAGEMTLHRLGEWLVLELVEVEDAGPPTDEVRELTTLAQVGRLTSRLIHDFKNQMGGLKLYASYLKKRLAAADVGAAGKESVEIADKILENLNLMAENATLVSRLAKPVELLREPGSLSLLIEQALSDQRPRAAARQVILISHLAETPELDFDAPQLRGALAALLGRAVDVTPEAGQVTIDLQCADRECVLCVVDQGATLSDLQRQTLFDFVTHERLNKTALEFGHAKRVVEQHGGTLQAEPAETGGTLVRLALPLS